MNNQHFDTCSVGVLDFSTNEFETFEVRNGRLINEDFYSYFDLASLTKPLTLATAYLKDPNIFSKEMKLLLNHKAGLPAWSRLSSDSWKEEVLSFDIREDATEYSDLGALRLQLEIEKAISGPLYDYVSDTWSPEIFHWTELPKGINTPVTGIRNNEKVNGVVHDDNAFNIKDKLSHAGLFGTLNGVIKTLITLNEKLDLLNKMEHSYKKINTNDRFIDGWDRVTDLESTLAGNGCSRFTFGHLGFTGTSIWIDLEKKRAGIILTNATQSYWYDRKGLTELRKELGQLIWK